MKLELRAVSKRFGPIRALQDVSLEVPSGRALALVGPNGSGKSTLIRGVVGLLRCDGEVLFDGAPRTPGTARHVAYVPQLAPSLAAPVGELVRAIASVHDIEPEEVGRTASALMLDLEAIRRQPFRNLSGGMKHKLLLALALSHQASLYVLDEPTASLDVESRARFFELFQRRCRGATLILCSHRLDEIQHLVEHVVALKEGRVAYDGAAAPYVSTRGESVIELRVRDAELARWLSEQGFSAGSGGWWGRTVGHDQKLALLRLLTERLDGQLDDIVIRDLERLEPEQLVEGRLNG